jgi:hypothetical protein
MQTRESTSWNLSWTKMLAAGRRRRLAWLGVIIIMAGLGASACDDPGNPPDTLGDPAECLAAYIAVRDGSGPCTECSAAAGLTITISLVNECEQAVEFTTSSSCLEEGFWMIDESGVMHAVGFACFGAVTERRMEPGQVFAGTSTWGGVDDDLSGAWGPLEPGRYRLRLEMTTNVVTDLVLAPPVETEIVVTAP